MLEALLAMTLGCLVIATVFDVSLVVNRLSMQETALMNMQDDMRFIHFFLRRKIHMAGNGSCLMQSPSDHEAVIQRLSPDAAKRAYGVNADSQSDVLLLWECVRVDQQDRYMPLLFFIARTSYSLPESGVQNETSVVNVLYYQIGRHPREALASGVDQFHVAVQSDLSDVIVHYRLRSIEPVLAVPSRNYFFQQGVLYANQMTEKHPIAGAPAEAR